MLGVGRPLLPVLFVVAAGVPVWRAELLEGVALTWLAATSAGGAFLKEGDILLSRAGSLEGGVGVDGPRG